MTFALALLLAAAPAPVDRGALEARAADSVAAAFQSAKKPVPARDPGLSLAARDLAEQLASGKLASSALAEAVPAAIARNGGWDPAPRTLLLAGNAPDSLVQFLRNQPSLTEDPCEVFGVGIAANKDKLTLLVLTARRYADLKPFPRTLPVGGGADLDVTLRAPLKQPQLVLTGPDGKAETSTNAVAQGEHLSAPLRFPKPGRYAVEVMGRSAEGPRVAALFSVLVGNAPTATNDIADPPEPADPMIKIDAVLEHIGKLRARHGLKPLEHDHTLDLLALEHAEDMATHHFFAHVSPTRGDLHARLNGRYGYVRAGENLGEASGALAAERAIEASPAHLENTLDPNFTRIGLALYPDTHPGGEVTLMLTEIFATPPPRSAHPDAAVFDAIAQARTQAHVPPAARDATLDQVAREHLATMIQDGAPGGERDAQDAALERDDALQSVAVDLFVASAPEDAVHSHNLASPTFNRVGVAAQLVTSRRYGADRLWIVVLYGQALRR